MPTSQSSSKAKRDEAEDEEQLDELVEDDAQQEYVRSRKTEDLAEAASTQHQYTHLPKTPFCRTCQRARMMAQARKKGGQKRIETEMFGDHIIGDHVIIKRNVEEGFRGEQVALVLKDLHTQYRYVYPGQSKDSQICVDGLNHFIGSKRWCSSCVYWQFPRIDQGHQGFGVQTSNLSWICWFIKVVCWARSSSDAGRCQKHLLQSGLPLKMWPLAMQHHATAITARPQLDGSESPWQLRFGEEFPAMHIPFGAKVLFWNNPKRADNTAGKLFTNFKWRNFPWVLHPTGSWLEGWILSCQVGLQIIMSTGVRWQFKEQKGWNYHPGVSSFFESCDWLEGTQSRSSEDQVIRKLPKLCRWNPACIRHKMSMNMSQGRPYQPTVMSSLMHPLNPYFQISSWPPKVK